MNIQSLQNQTEGAAAFLKALANEKRLQIVCILVQGEKNVGELEEIVGLSQSALSQHLARLRRDDVVDTRREAQTIYYSLKDPAVVKVLECLNGVYTESPC